MSEETPEGDAVLEEELKKRAGNTAEDIHRELLWDGSLSTSRLDRELPGKDDG